ncbi:alpha/beta hydrolase [Robiginitalea sp.]|uniref:alpha/beta hydrolase n=1 Tax=Robiginitalea sp. TaxID=1902411 RepID=UPI003C7544EF
MPAKTPTQSQEKFLSIQASHPYETLNQWTPDTKRVWVVFHGIGYLSRYFLRHFHHLDPRENYIIAPQAPALYYLDQTYTHIGASWLTRENTRLYMDNLLQLLDELWNSEKIHTAPSLVLMGYSQGVSVLCRWIVARKLKCERLLLYAGRVPEELNAEDFEHLAPQTKVDFFLGDKDPFVTSELRAGLKDRMELLFGDRLEVNEFSGGHTVINSLITP